MRKLYKYLPFIISGIVFLCVAVAVYLWTSSYNSWTLREHLKTLSPLFLEINLFLIIVALGITIKSFFKSSHLRDMFGEIPKRVWLLLGVVSILGLVLVMFVVPREHRIYYDEDIYQNIAQNIAYTKGEGSHYGKGYLQSLSGVWKRFTGRAGMCNEGKNEYGEYTCFRLEYNKQPNGWPYILSVVFRLFGVHELASFLTNNVVFLLSIITVFFLGYLLFEDYYSAIYSALIFALTPEALNWSNTVAVEPSAAFFPALAVLCTLFFLRTRTLASLFLTVVITAFAVQFRPESVMICAVIGILCLFRGRDELKKGGFYLIASIFSVLIISHIVHLYAVKDIEWGSSGSKFSLDFFEENFKVNSLFYLRNMRFPAVFTVLFFLGICLKSPAKNSYIWKEKLVVLVWFLLFWGIFIFFYAGSYNYGADVRFSLLSYIPLSLIAGCGASLLVSQIKEKFKIHSIGYIVTSVIILFFISFLPFLRAITQEAWAARADHRFAREMAKELPQNSVVLTHNPNMFLLWGKNAAQASLATEQRGYFKSFFRRYKGGVYFHYNFWCNVDDPLQKSFCKNILNRFKCTSVMSFREKNYKFVLYKLERKKRNRK